MDAFFQELTVAKNSERHSMTPKYIHKLNLRFNMSYNMRHALNTVFCVLSVSCLVGELVCCLLTTVMLTVCYIKRQPGRAQQAKSQIISACDLVTCYQQHYPGLED